ncbi:NUDIX hydrolase [Streptomyces vinaceus]|uniref:NUDIX hydrolase n=1 Tax=Streptomyces vinaceus TaxID=1960 RepID=UPI0036B78FA7
MSESKIDHAIQYTADVVAVTPSRHVLLTVRDGPPFEGAWALPGGYVDAGEAPYVAAVRELAEETGVHVPVGAVHQIGVWDPSRRSAALAASSMTSGQKFWSRHSFAAKASAVGSGSRLSCSSSQIRQGSYSSSTARSYESMRFSGGPMP